MEQVHSSSDFTDETVHDINTHKYQMYEEDVKRRKCLCSRNPFLDLTRKFFLWLISLRTSAEDKFNWNNIAAYYESSDEHECRDNCKPLNSSQKGINDGSNPSDEDEAGHKHILTNEVHSQVPSCISDKAKQDEHQYQSELKLDQLFKQNEDIKKAQTELKSSIDVGNELMQEIKTELITYHELIQRVKRIQENNRYIREELISIKRLLNSSIKKTSSTPTPKTIRGGVTHKTFPSLASYISASSIPSRKSDTGSNSGVYTGVNKILSHSSIPNSPNRGRIAASQPSLHTSKP